MQAELQSVMHIWFCKVLAAKRQSANLSKVLRLLHLGVVFETLPRPVMSPEPALCVFVCVMYQTKLCPMQADGHT